MAHAQRAATGGTSGVAQSAPAAAPAPAIAAAVARGVLDPPLTLDQIRSWRNIPEVIREGMMSLLEYTAGLARTTQAVAIAVNRKAEQEALDSLAGSRVGIEQFTELARFVQRDILGRLDQPCASHIATNKAVATLTTKLAQLEALVAAQDTTIAALQRELANKANVEDVEQCISRTGFEDAAAGVARRVISESVEPALRSKADASSLQLVVRDLHTLNAEIQTRPSREDVGTAIDGRLHSLRSSLQSSVDAATRSVAEMRASVEAKAGKDEGVPGAWKAKVASITAAFDGKLEKVRSEVLAEVASRIDPQLGDIVAALNKKAYKSDVAAALAEKASLAKVDALLAAKADGEDTAHALRRKADVSEVAAVKRALLDLAQTVLTSGGGGGEGGSSAGSVSSQGVPPAALAAVQERLAVVSSAADAAAASAEAATAAVTSTNTRFNALASEVAELRAQVDGSKARRAQSNVLRGVAVALSGKGSSNSAMQWLAGGAAGAANGEGAAPLNETLDAEADAAAVAAIQDSLIKLSAAVSTKAEWAEVAPTRDAAAEAKARVAALEHSIGVLKAEVETLRGVLGTQSEALVALKSANKAEATAAPSQDKGAAASAGAGGAVVPAATITGRWVWKSRYLDPDTSRVRWDIESHNSAPEGLVWRSPLGGAGAGKRGLLDADASAQGHEEEDEEDDPSCSVVTSKPGLYRVALGFFAAAPPALTLVVDGHPAVSTPAPAAAGPDGDADALLVGSAIIHRHPAGSVAGVSLVQYLALPAHARLAVLYDGEVLGQGFMEVTKL